MSNLSETECRAGISRAALDVARRNNGHNNSQTKTTEIAAKSSGLSAKVSRTETFTDIATTIMTSVVCTPYRNVEVLEGVDGMSQIRETTWDNRQAHVSVIWLRPYERVALRDALNKLEEASEERQTARKP